MMMNLHLRHIQQLSVAHFYLHLVFGCTCSISHGFHKNKKRIKHWVDESMFTIKRHDQYVWLLTKWCIYLSWYRKATRDSQLKILNLIFRLIYNVILYFGSGYCHVICYFMAWKRFVSYKWRTVNDSMGIIVFAKLIQMSNESIGRKFVLCSHDFVF